MEYPKFIPEGWEEELPIMTKEKLNKAMLENSIIQGKVTMCDSNYNLYVDLGNDLTGVIPRNEIDVIKGIPNSRVSTNKVNKI